VARTKESRKVESVTDFLQRVLGINEEWKDATDLWFRGQPEDLPLRPRLYRHAGRDEEPNEDEIRVDFERNGIQLVQREPKDYRDWYFLMQHYGAPTRLLDWTDGALFGLYFAVRESKAAPQHISTRGHQENLDAVVWVLDPGWLNKEVTKEEVIFLKDSDEVRPYLREPLSGAVRKPYPIAIDPPHVDRRLTVQRSHFTLFGATRDGLGRVVRRARKKRHGVGLLKIKVDRAKAGRIREELSICGIVETSVFPDLEGLAKELEYLWT
jgi:hypothetical protein